MASLKVSNVHNNLDVLVERMRKVNSPGKKKLIEAIKNNDFRSIFKELLFRIELYTKAKVLNYTGADLKEIMLNIHKYGLEPFVNVLTEKAVDEISENLDLEV